MFGGFYFSRFQFIQESIPPNIRCKNNKYILCRYFWFFARRYMIVILAVPYKIQKQKPPFLFLLSSPRFLRMNKFTPF